MTSSKDEVPQLKLSVLAKANFDKVDPTLPQKMSLHVNIFSKTFLPVLSLDNVVTMATCPTICCKISLQNTHIFFLKIRIQSMQD